MPKPNAVIAVLLTEMMRKRTWVSRVLDRALELRRLERKARNLSRPRGCEMVKHNDHRAVWRVPVPGTPDRFMSASSGHTNRETFVVQVEAELFYRTWLAGTPMWGRWRLDDCVPRTTMPNDHSYPFAESSFAYSRIKPVPLAEVAAWIKRGRMRVAVLNGVGTMFWLLANHAPVFPVKVRGHDAADLLYRSVGCGPAPLCFAHLFMSEGVSDDRYREGG